MLSENLQKQLDQNIPKKDQARFIEQAVKEKLTSLDTKPEKTLDARLKKNSNRSAHGKVREDKNFSEHKADDGFSGFVELYTDGGARGNPGVAGGGFVIFKNGSKVHEGSEFFGHKTNNQSEYLALRLGLREAYEQFAEAKVDCYMDSELIVKQMNGEYKVKNKDLKPIYEEVRRIADQFKQFTVRHIDRSQNKLADELANKAMDRGC